jgi:hypothetical protein
MLVCFVSLCVQTVSFLNPDLLLPTQLWNFQNSVDQYNAYGGTGTKSVKAQIANLGKWMESLPVLS